MTIHFNLKFISPHKSKNFKKCKKKRMIHHKPELKSKSRPAVPKFDDSWSPESETRNEAVGDQGP